MSRIVHALAVFAVLADTPAFADGFHPVESRSTFVSLVGGKNLRRMGVTLAVTPRGQIRGEAFGKRVTGAWRWDGKFFCRDIHFGQRKLGPNCEAVKVRGRTVRFITDKGTGQHADLRLD